MISWYETGSNSESMTALQYAYTTHVGRCRWEMSFGVTNCLVLESEKVSYHSKAVSHQLWIL